MREALLWFRPAAAQGHPQAMNSVGVIYDLGLGLKRDKQEAVVWFRKAAELGDRKGQSNLGRCYTTGAGVERNAALAYQWLTLSAEQGEVTATNCLDDFRKAMKPEEIAEGERLLAEYRARAEAAPTKP